MGMRTPGLWAAAVLSLSITGGCGSLDDGRGSSFGPPTVGRLSTLGPIPTVIYRGRVLPSPVPVYALAQQLPPAWVVSGSSAVPATYYDFCRDNQCIGFGYPQELESIATVSLPSEQNIRVILGPGATGVKEVSLTPWREQPGPAFDPSHSLRVLGYESAGSSTVVTLASPEVSGEQLLAVSANLNGGGYADYLWKLTAAGKD